MCLAVAVLIGMRGVAVELGADSVKEVYSRKQQLCLRTGKCVLQNPMTVLYNIISPAEIGALLNVSRQTVNNWRGRYTDFPRPVHEVNGTPLFDRTEVLVWLISREKAESGSLVFDFERKKVLNEALFGANFAPKFGAFDHYNRVSSKIVAVGDRVKLTIQDTFGQRQIYEATISLEWGGNYLAHIQRSYTNEGAWDEDHFPKVGEYHFIEPSMITVGKKHDGTQYGGASNSIQADEGSYVLKLYSPRSMVKVGYKLKLQKESLEFFRFRNKIAICKWDEQTGLTWKKRPTVEEILSNDGIFPPVKFPERLQYVYRDYLFENLSRFDIEPILAELSVWINAVTESRPKLDFWEGLF